MPLKTEENDTKESNDFNKPKSKTNPSHNDTSNGANNNNSNSSIRVKLIQRAMDSNENSNSDVKLVKLHSEEDYNGQVKSVQQSQNIDRSKCPTFYYKCDNDTVTISGEQELEAAIDYLRENGQKVPYTIYVDTKKLRRYTNPSESIMLRRQGNSGERMENIPFVGAADSLVGLIRNSISSEQLLPSIIQSMNTDIQNSESATVVLNRAFEEIFKVESNVDDKIVAMSTAFVQNTAPIIDPIMTRYREQVSNTLYF